MIAADPTVACGTAAAERCTNRCPTEKASAVRLAKGAGGVDVSRRHDHDPIGPGPTGRSLRRGGGWRACQRSSQNEWGYVGKRDFDKAFLSNHKFRRLPFAASVGHQGQRCRALLI